jgi:EAL domain-containing protein (putative c-di-GMP-specific phosphodiesterase class I)
MSVNLSSKHFAHPNVLGEIREALEQNGLNPRSLKLEITETGTGHSSLSRLTRLPLHVFKVDRSFVKQI